MAGSILADGARAIVTGGSAGIGAALVAALLARGVRVTTLSRHSPTLTHDRLHWIEADFSDPVVVDRICTVLATEFGEIDLLINNAGIQRSIDFVADPTATQLAEELHVNLLAPIQLALALIPLLARRPRAVIVNVTSVLAIAPKRSAPVYCASKAGLRAFTRALRYQVDSSAPHIKVIEAVPPLVDTAMTRGRGGRKAEPEAVANAIVAGIDTGLDEIWIGQARLFRLLHRLSPTVAARLMRDG